MSTPVSGPGLEPPLHPGLKRVLLRLGFLHPRELHAAAEAYEALLRLVEEAEPHAEPQRLRTSLARLVDEVVVSTATVSDEPTEQMKALDPRRLLLDLEGHSSAQGLLAGGLEAWGLGAPFERSEASRGSEGSESPAGDSGARLDRDDGAWPVSGQPAHDPKLARDVLLLDLSGAGPGANLPGSLQQDHQGDAATNASSEETQSHAAARARHAVVVAATLNHPSVATVYEISEAPDGRIVAAVGRMPGSTLADALASRPRLKDRLALFGAFEECCRGVAYAHRRGIVHRRLSAEVVRVGEQGEAVITGWDSALVRATRDRAASKLDQAPEASSAEPLPRLAETNPPLRPQSGVKRRFARCPSTTAPRDAVGTSMSPEQARGDWVAVDERSDVFGLGAILFELLCGRAPHVGQDAEEAITKAARRRAPPVELFCRAAPRDLAKICDRALHFDPRERYANAGELLDALAEFSSRLYQQAFPENPANRILQSLRRNLRTLIPAAVIVIACALYAATQWSLLGNARIDAESQRDEVRRTLAVMLSDRAAETDSPHQAMLYASASLMVLEQPEARGTIARMALEPKPKLRWQSRPGAKCRSLAFADEERLSCADEADTWFQWSLQDGAEIGGILRSSDSIVLEVVSRDGNWRATADKGGTVRVFGFDEAGARTYDALQEPVVALDVTTDPAGSALVAALGRQGILRILGDSAVPEGEQLPVCSGARAVALSPGGDLVALGCPREIEVRSALGARPRAAQQIPVHATSALSFAGDGSSLIAGNSRGQVVVARIDSPAPRDLLTLGSTVTAVALSRDGSTFAAGSAMGRIATGPSAGSQRPTRVPAHTGPVWAVALNPRGDRIASSGPDGTIKIFRARDGTKEREIASDSHWIYDVVFTPDGKQVISCNTDGTWSVRSAETGALELRVSTASELVGRELIKLAVSPDGRTLAVGDATGFITRWELATGGLVDGWPAHGSAIWALRYTARGQIVSGAASGEVTLWTGQNPEILVSARDRGSAVVDAARDGRVLVYTDGDAVRVEDLDRSASFSLPVRAENVTAIGVSLDAEFLAIAEGKKLGVWDLATRSLSRTLASHTETIQDVAFSPNGLYLASAAQDGKVKLWHVPDGRLVATLDHGDHVRALAFSPSGDLLATGGWDRSVRVYDVRLGASPVLHGHTQPVRALAFADDGVHLVSTGRDATVRRWHLAEGKELDKRPVPGEQILALSRDGLRFVSSDRHGVASLWDLERGTKRTLLAGQAQPVAQSAFSPNGAMVATLGHSGELLAWSVSDQRLLRFDRAARGPAARGLAISSAGMLVTADMPKALVEVWSIDEPTSVRELTGHSNWVTAVAISPDGERIVSGGYDGTIHVWHSRSGRREGVLPSAQKVVHHLSFSPTGRYVAAGGSDGSLRLFDHEAGREVATLRGYAGGQVAFSPDEGLLAAATDANGIRLFDLSALTRAPSDIMTEAARDSGLVLQGARLSPDIGRRRSRFE